VRPLMSNVALGERMDRYLLAAQQPRPARYTLASKFIDARPAGECANNGQTGNNLKGKVTLGEESG
jgi:hypothetical protein